MHYKIVYVCVTHMFAFSSKFAKKNNCLKSVFACACAAWCNRCCISAFNYISTISQVQCFAFMRCEYVCVCVFCIQMNACLRCARLCMNIRLARVRLICGVCVCLCAQNASVCIYESTHLYKYGIIKKTIRAIADLCVCWDVCLRFFAVRSDLKMSNRTGDTIEMWCERCVAIHRCV